MMLLCSIHCSALAPAEKHRESIVLLLIQGQLTLYPDVPPLFVRGIHVKHCRTLGNKKSHNGPILALGNDLKPLTMYTYNKPALMY